MKIKGNEKYDSIQLQCHSTSLSTQPNPSHVLENATQPNAWMDPTHVPSLGRHLSPSVLFIAPALPPLGSRVRLKPDRRSVPLSIRTLNSFASYKSHLETCLFARRY